MPLKMIEKCAEKAADELGAMSWMTEGERRAFKIDAKRQIVHEMKPLAAAVQKLEKYIENERFEFTEWLLFEMEKLSKELRSDSKHRKPLCLLVDRANKQLDEMSKDYFDNYKIMPRTPALKGTGHADAAKD